MSLYVLLFLGALGLFLGFPNPLVHLPLAVLLYPFSLYILGKKAKSQKQACLFAWLCSSLGHALVMAWVVIPMNEVAGIPYFLAFPFAVLLGMYMGLFGCAFVFVVYKIRNENKFFQVIFLGLAFCLLEFFRAWLFTGLPWANLATAFVPYTALVQGASFIGAFGLSGLFAAVAIVPPIYTNKAGAYVFVALFFLGLFALGSLRISQGDFAFSQELMQNTRKDLLENKRAERSKILPILMVQGNIEQHVKWTPEWQQRTVRRYVDLSREALFEAKAQGTKPALIVWPETAMPFDVKRSQGFLSYLYNFAEKNEVSLLFGAPGFEYSSSKETGTQAESQYKVFNRAYLLQTQKEESIQAIQEDVPFYEKEHLVPFGEYLPTFLDLPFLRPLLQGIGNFTPGEVTKPLFLSNDGAQVPLGLLICYEAIFPSLARERVAEGAEIFINISNDAWFGKSSAAEQHLHLAAMRSIEQGRAMARATNTGISALIDPYGRISQSTKLFESSYIIVNVPLFQEKTHFYYFEPIFLLVSLGVFVALLGILFVKGRGSYASTA